MQSSLPSQTIGCIGKCTSGLSIHDLDQITDNIHKTLTHPRGREIFRNFLEQRGLTDNLKCLALYETCLQILTEESNFSHSKKETTLESLTNRVMQVKEIAEDLGGVRQIDMELLQRFNEALNSNSRSSLLSILADTKNRCRDHLNRVHGSFKQYASKPCPRIK
ncbi:uncharacterized protein LOC132916405 [Bombus pascuorum]|uniref:uncharacterized protein LOC132916405 n=1 Tax=Bombus pascuorum TaxID=65598 RepID=UPI0021270CE6|nr:uncharacterized protein LOC132916405 [Bombus pascuorum]XP_060832365.1 uncharacterized protein LOC132916405 [Bombus pascuorum]XP_060832366.1 uncharacterized protein LOC132916405 [Bombus pascuorum]